MYFFPVWVIFWLIPPYYYTRLDQKSKLFETSSIAIGTKELPQRKIFVRETSFFYKMAFWKVY